jgi:hypothetical protein
MAKRIGIVLSHRNSRRSMLQALAIGRICGQRAAERELSQARADIVRLRAKLERAEDRYRLARSIIDRGDGIAALQSRDPLATIH